MEHSGQNAAVAPEAPAVESAPVPKEAGPASVASVAPPESLEAREFLHFLLFAGNDFA